MLKSGALYEDLGSDHFDKRGKSRHIHRLVHRRKTSDLQSKSPPGDGRLVSTSASSRRVCCNRIIGRQTAAGRPSRAGCFFLARM
jgi:hypothetical protein